MSTAPRSKRRQQESHQPSASPLPATKRLKSSHVPAQQSGLGFLVDEDARAGRKIDAKLTNGAPRSKSTRVDESHAGVAPNTDQDDEPKAPPEIIDISSGEEESSELEEDEDEDEDEGLLNRKPLTNGHIEDGTVQAAVSGAEDEDMADADDDEPQDEPTFGDLLQARHPEPIDVGKSLLEADQDSRGLVPMSGSSKAKTGHSLGVMLSQALKNNDKQLLETCFAEVNLQTIRNTIQRTKPQEIADLLSKIAERIHSKPGRTGTLLVWVHHSLIVHGGYLATQPELMKRMKTLARVVRERASSLQPLLHLKGKLDLLHQQLLLRSEMLGESRMNDEDMDDPNGVLYIEGEDQDSSDSDDAAEEGDDGRQARGQKMKQWQGHGGEPSGDENMDAGLPNGLDGDESADEDDDLDGMLDIEAEEGSENDEEDSSNEEADSEEEDEDEDDNEGESEDEESDTIAVKPRTLNRKR